MPRPVLKTSCANRCARVPVLTLAAAWLLLPLSAQAARAVPVYTVDVAERGGSALQDAMRQALVRATGQREAADDAALATIVADAPKYVKDWDTGERGQSQVVFDGTAIDRAVTAAGRALWDPARPYTLVVLDPPRRRAAADAARAQLEKVAAERGLLISVGAFALNDSAGAPLDGAALMEAAHVAGGDQLLVGRGDGTASTGALQWTLYTSATAESWQGPLAAAIDHVVDGLVPRPSGALAQAESPARVRIEGVNTLTDYANITRLLQATLGGRRVGVRELNGSSVVYDASVRGGVAGLEQLLAGQARFARVADGVYRYQPQAGTSP